MKRKLKQNQKNNAVGQGHKARFAMTAKITVNADGKKQQFNIDYDVTLTVEMIDYAVRLIAGRISEITGKIAGDGIPKREEAVVA